jgi:hypothetical protein
LLEKPAIILASPTPINALATTGTFISQYHFPEDAPNVEKPYPLSESLAVNAIEVLPSEKVPPLTYLDRHKGFNVAKLLVGVSVA